jgi:hypothetical protein
MSTKYNHFAKDLDAAFKAARDEYAAAYNAVEQTRKAMQDAGPDALKRQIATLQLQEAENKMRTETARIWAAFDAKAAELRGALASEVQASKCVDPTAVDAAGVELMKSGIMTADDYFTLAAKYDGNTTMLRLLSKYAADAAADEDNRKDRAALITLSRDCANGTGTTLRAWDDLMNVANYCSGRGGSGNRRITPGVTLSMGEKWEQLSGEIVENF